MPLGNLSERKSLIDGRSLVEQAADNRSEMVKILSGRAQKSTFSNLGQCAIYS